MVSQFDHSVSNVKSHHVHFWERKLYCQQVVLLVVLSFHIFWKGTEIFSVERENDCFSDFFPTIIWRKYFSSPPSLLFYFSVCISNTNRCRYECFKNRHVDTYKVKKKKKIPTAHYHSYLLDLELHQEDYYWKIDTPDEGIL